MRKIASLGWTLVILSGLVGGCEKSNDKSDDKAEELSLSGALDRGAFTIDNAVEEIKKSPGYELFMRGASHKSAVDGDAPALTIFLDDIKGVYEYAPQQNGEEETPSAHTGSCKSYFQKTGDSDWFIIHLPLEKVKHPHQLFKYNSGDEAINNLLLTTSEFIYAADRNLMRHDYHLATRFDIDDEYAGELWVDEVSNGLLNTLTTSKFGFTDEYFVTVTTQFSDTIKVAYFLQNADEDTLYSETVAFSMKVVDGNPNLQFEYEMKIGDVRIVKQLDDENKLVYVVYKEDERQENASVRVIVLAGESKTSVNCLFMNRNKDLEVTFDDESTILLSELIGDSQEVLASLFGSMKELYLSKMIINRLAWQIYSEHNGTGDANRYMRP